MEMKQGLFNNFHKYFLVHPEEYTLFESRFIIKLYCIDKFSCGEIIEMLKGYPRRIAQVSQLRKIILNFDKSLWRGQQDACNTDRAKTKKKNAWKNPTSGYNTSDTMRHKTRSKP